MGAQSLGRALCCSLVLALAHATTPPAAAAAAVDNHYQALAAFTAISVPIAYDGNLVAGPDNVTYDISMVGPTAVLDAFQPVVADSTLTLGFKLPVPEVSNDQVNYTIRMPAGTLKALSTSTSGFFEANGRVATSGTLSIAASGSGFTSIVGLPSSAVTARAAGTGTLYFEGEGMQLAQFAGEGTGVTYISGVSNKVTVDLTGGENVIVDASLSTTLQITGAVAGLGKVYYNGGTCSVVGTVGDPCVLSQVQLPL